MEIKQEITQIINTLPTEKLSEVLQYLRGVEKVSKAKIQLSRNLKTVLLEDKTLLEKLAK
jgi:hypothetical protein